MHTSTTNVLKAYNTNDLFIPTMNIATDLYAYNAKQCSRWILRQPRLYIYLYTYIQRLLMFYKHVASLTALDAYNFNQRSIRV